MARPESSQIICFSTTARALWFATVLMFAADASATEFGTKGGPEPANIDEIATVLRQDSYDMELLISYGTSKGGSAGHVALAIRDPASGDEPVYSANFYADRAPKHAKGFYTDDLMVRIPKKEYLFKTSSSLGDTASFGLDFGEIYKRSVIGVRVYGVPAAEKEAVAAFFKRINDDYHNRARNTEYHDREIRYDYLRLNCAKTIGAAFKYGAGYQDLDVTSAKLFSGTKGGGSSQRQHSHGDGDQVSSEWNRRGYGWTWFGTRSTVVRPTWTHTKRKRWRSRTCRTGSLPSCPATSGKSRITTRTSTICSRCTSSTT